MDFSCRSRYLCKHSLIQSMLRYNLVSKMVVRARWKECKGPFMGYDFWSPRGGYSFLEPLQFEAKDLENQQSFNSQTILLAFVKVLCRSVRNAASPPVVSLRAAPLFSLCLTLADADLAVGSRRARHLANTNHARLSMESLQANIESFRAPQSTADAQLLQAAPGMSSLSVPSLKHANLANVPAMILCGSK